MKTVFSGEDMIIAFRAGCDAQFKENSKASPFKQNLFNTISAAERWLLHAYSEPLAKIQLGVIDDPGRIKITDCDFSIRALNCLRALEVETLGQLAKFSVNDLLKSRVPGNVSIKRNEI